MTDRCFYLINREEESSKVSCVVSVSKPDYVEKMSFPPKGYVEKIRFKSLPPKGESKKSMKKKKKRSKRREDTVSSPKHYDPSIVLYLLIGGTVKASTLILEERLQPTV
jgi:hypothetical protein